ncbi:DUF2929 domain-containing protein [Bacillus sp. FJAT-27225]|uniref:YjzD family protein n=1 Tax=Bacillus sp. FJAT-27225 TaxID=1743144 RepID=UPI00080C35B0|nr:YjzD family protein [Bacillus sp. FJAT-27225]OCA84273.1 DUF2929 domain-containing protein [Bacillus sp. FJAT-27225]
MKYFWTFFWVILLVEMLSYVVTSMIGAAFDFKNAAVVGVITAAIISIAPVLLPNDPVEHQNH